MKKIFLTALTAQNGPKLKIHVENVAQDPSVYYSVSPLSCQKMDG